MKASQIEGPNERPGIVTVLNKGKQIMSLNEGLTRKGKQVKELQIISSNEDSNEGLE